MQEIRLLRTNDRNTIYPGKVPVIRDEIIETVMRTAGSMESIRKEEAVLL